MAHSSTDEESPQFIRDPPRICRRLNFLRVRWQVTVGAAGTATHSQRWAQIERMPVRQSSIALKQPPDILTDLSELNLRLELYVPYPLGQVSKQHFTSPHCTSAPRVLLSALGNRAFTTAAMFRTAQMMQKPIIETACDKMPRATNGCSVSPHPPFTEYGGCTLSNDLPTFLLVRIPFYRRTCKKRAAPPAFTLNTAGFLQNNASPYPTHALSVSQSLFLLRSIFTDTLPTIDPRNC